MGCSVMQKNIMQYWWLRHKIVIFVGKFVSFIRFVAVMTVSGLVGNRY